MRIGAPTVSEVDRLERLEGSLRDRAVRHLRIAHLERKHDVLERVEARQEALLLEHERNFAAEVVETVAPPPVKSEAAHPQLARIRSQLAVDQAQQGGLAGAAPSGYLDQLARRDCEIDTLEDAGLAKRFGDAKQLDRRLDCELAFGRRAAPGRPIFLRLHAVSLTAVFGRAGAASCCWSASHPSRPD